MFSTLVGCFVLQALAVQIPLGTPSTIESYNSHTDPDPSNLDPSHWHLDDPPPANATGHLVFETVNSLLQHWPNTRYRNGEYYHPLCPALRTYYDYTPGHAVVPGVIPKGTLLYHGAFSDKIPTVPEWTATDPEHSILFCRGQRDTGCWHLTLATTRPLKILYFDGTSAANTMDGTLDSQDVIAWGEMRPDWWTREAQRLGDLCKWGAPYAIDGYVR